MTGNDNTGTWKKSLWGTIITTIALRKRRPKCRNFSKKSRFWRPNCAI